jgi:hypothetical protein
MNQPNEFTSYEISFILDQRGEYTDWVLEVLSSGLREGEGIYSFALREIPEHELITQ